MHVFDLKNSLAPFISDTLARSSSYIHATWKPVTVVLCQVWTTMHDNSESRNVSYNLLPPGHLNAEDLGHGISGKKGLQCLYRIDS